MQKKSVSIIQGNQGTTMRNAGESEAPTLSSTGKFTDPKLSKDNANVI